MVAKMLRNRGEVLDTNYTKLNTLVHSSQQEQQNKMKNSKEIQNVFMSRIPGSKDEVNVKSIDDRSQQLPACCN